MDENHGGSAREAERRGRDHGLDVLRAIAIAGVLFVHSVDLQAAAPAGYERISAYGWMGVDLFFVLSGFLIAKQTFAEPDEASFLVSVRRFWVKRWLRTLPLYFVVLFVFAFVKPMLLGFPFRGEFWRYALFTQNYGPHLDFIPSWSLCVEEHFYLFFPLVVYPLKRARVLPEFGWLALFVATCLIRAFTLVRLNDLADITQRVSWPTHTHLDGIALGVFLAATERRWSAWSVRARAACGIAGVVMFVAVCWACGSYVPASRAVAMWVYAGLAIAFALLLVGARAVTLPGRLYVPFNRVAIWSYGIYLWHPLVTRLIARTGHHLPWWPAQAAAFVAMTACIAFVTHHAIELPAMSLRKRLLASRFLGRPVARGERGLDAGTAS